MKNKRLPRSGKHWIALVLVMVFAIGMMAGFTEETDLQKAKKEKTRLLAKA